MPRFYIAQEISSPTIAISDSEHLHHLKDVLRLRVDDELTIFDAAGNEYDCLITGLDQKQVVLAVKAKRLAKARKLKVAIACAIPKKAKMDEIIDNLTQLGADLIIPVETDRVIVKLDDSRKQARLERWRRIAQNASQQSQRTDIPLIEPVASMKNVVSRSEDFDLKLILTLSGERKHIREVMAESKPHNILILIGPEGDFTQQEIELAKSGGFVPVSLGGSVLRVSTAAIAVTSYVKFSLTD